MKVGTVSDVSLQRRQGAGDLHASTARSRSGRTPPRTSAPARCWASGCSRWNPRATARCARRDVIPVSRTSSPYSLTEAVSDLTTQHRGHRHRHAQPVPGHPVGDDRSDRAPAGSDVRRADPAVAVDSTSRNETLARAAQERQRRHRDPVGAQPAGEHADPQRQRPARGARTIAARRSSSLLANTSALSKQLSGLVADNETGAGTDAGEAQLGDRDAGEEPRQHRQGAAGLGEVSRSPRVRRSASGSYYNAFVPNLTSAQTAAAVPRLRVRIPAGRQRRATAGQRRAARRTSRSRTTEFRGGSR